MIPHVKEFNTNGCSRIDDWYFSELTIKSSFYQKNTGEKIDIQKNILIPIARKKHLRSSTVQHNYYRDMNLDNSKNSLRISYNKWLLIIWKWFQIDKKIVRVYFKSVHALQLWPFSTGKVLLLHNYVKFKHNFIDYDKCIKIYQ